MWRRVVACLILNLMLISVLISAGSGEDTSSELEVFAGQDKFGYIDIPVQFNDASIIKPSPLDPNMTYHWSWDFSIGFDTDQDGVYDNDNDSLDQFSDWIYHAPGIYLVTCTVTDGTRSSKDSLLVAIRPLEEIVLDTDKDTYRPGETIEVTWRIDMRGTGGPDTMLVINGEVSFQLFDEEGDLIITLEQTFYLSDGGSTDTIVFSFVIEDAGEYRLVANSSYPHRISDVNRSWEERNSPPIKEIIITVAGDPLYVVPVASIDVKSTTIDVSNMMDLSAGGSYDPDGEIVSFEWDMGDGAVSYGEGISHAFDKPGTYTIVLTVRDDDDLTASANVSITVRPIEPSDTPVPVFPAMTIVVLAVLAVAWSTEASKVALLGLGLPLYTKLRKEKVLDDFTRGRIFGYISAFPGEHYNSIKKALELPNGTFAHHLSVLEREGYLKSRTDRTLKRYYPMDMKVPSSEGTLKHTQVLIMEAIKETPGISQREVAAVLGLSSSTIGYHIEDLIEKGHVRKERRGMGVRYYVVDLKPVS